ncbi:MAG: zf-HC2 domain-containing protein [Deltaproteobacteria bacterium]|nr:zf-HC2 domain-containing protein [Deltaproteobacteria bacterium]MBI3076655.1 zf-HC2 domain-containing protein [Deltaproteobacteria bacterium]
MECQEVRSLLILYLDREVATREAAVMGQHLGSCAACAREAEVEQRLTRLLWASPVGIGLPDDLWDRITTRLRAPRSGLAGFGGPEARITRWLRRHRLAVGAVVAALLLALGLQAWGLWTREPRPVTDAVEDHITVIQGAAQVRIVASSPEEVRRWFAERLGRPVQPPDLRGSGAVLRGARLCITPEMVIPALEYEVRGQLVSLYVLPDMVPAPSWGRRQMRWGGVEFAYGRYKGYTALFWQARGQAYGLVGPEEPRLLAQVALTAVPGGR